MIKPQLSIDWFLEAVAISEVSETEVPVKLIADGQSGGRKCNLKWLFR